MSFNTANFPTEIWDGSTPNRTSRMQDSAPDYEDYDQVVAELIATQTLVFGLELSQANVVVLTDSSGGTANNTIVAVPSDSLANVAAACNGNFADVAAKINGILGILEDAGIMVGA
jgi:hypothetical protein